MRNLHCGRAAIYDGRDHAVGPPIIIYEPAFSRLKWQLGNLDGVIVSRETRIHVAHLLHVASPTYTDEDGRISAMHSTLEKLLAPSNAQLLTKMKDTDTGSEPDFRWMLTFKGSNAEAEVFLVGGVYRNELGFEGNPVAQAEQVYASFVSQRKVRSSGSNHDVILLRASMKAYAR